MPQTKHLKDRIFQINDDKEFNDLAIEIFHFQYEKNLLYQNFVKNLSISATNITHYTQIPFLPVEFFKSHKIVTGDFSPQISFSSSGTTGITTSNHLVKDISLYNNSFLKGFSHFFGDIDEFVILALLPSYLEREGSSLIFMVESLIEQSGKAESGFYLDELNNLHDLLVQLKNESKK